MDHKKRKEEYLKKLKDPRWQKKRLEILQRDDWTCQICLDKESTLHVHHRDYIKNTDPWNYPDKFLCTLCETCHESETLYMSEQISYLIQEAKLSFFSNDVWYLMMIAHHLQDKDLNWREFIMEVLEWACRTNNIFHLVELYFEKTPHRLKAAKEIPLMYILNKEGLIDEEKFFKLNSMLDDRDMIIYMENIRKTSHGSEASRDHARGNGVRKIKADLFS